MSIVVNEVSKVYEKQFALKNVSFKVNKPEIVGFLGPNGAGKSTMMKILTTYIPATSGQAEVNTFDVIKQEKQVQASIGYLPEHNPLHLELYVREYLAYNAKLYNVNMSRIDDVINQTGLQPESHKKIGQLSKGYRQRVGLANALLHNPDVLILDEPTTGLDPNQLIEIRQLIKTLGKEKTVFLSTHIMQEVEAMCDRVIIINKGELIVDKAISELKTSNEQVIKVTFDYKLEEQFIQRLPNLIHYKNTVDNNWRLTFEAKEDMRPVIFDFAQENGLKILGLNAENKDLESLFRELTS